MAVLGEKFFARDTKTVAMALLGKLLVRETKEGLRVGKVVETEAYYGLNDPGSHACNGPTPRSKIMFGPPGRAYVYFTYGNHWMFNAVTEKDGKPGAVLIRAVEPIAGFKLMRKTRGYKSARELCNGPGKLTEAFGITDKLNGKKLAGELYFTDGPSDKFAIVKTTRVGLAKGKGDVLKLRFYVKGNSCVSKL